MFLALWIGYKTVLLNKGENAMIERDDQLFLEIVHNAELRTALLGRLQELGLLDAFLRAESGTTPT